MINLHKILLFIGLSLMLVQCANQLPPPGGPVDEEPPQVLEVYPSNGTINFDDDHFELTFSEYIDKFSIMDAVFISPEVKNIGYDWSGTSVEITFDDTLKENTTYTVSIGSGIKDLNNKNNLAQAVNFAFSTGTKLDEGVIAGRVYDNDPNGIMIFAYIQTDTFANPIIVKPKNISQVGENGEFRYLGLANGTYRIFAVKEENKNRIYNIGEDMYGAPFQEITLTDSNYKFEGMNFRLTKEDTIAPYITSVTMTDRNHLLVEYSENIDSSKVTKDNFFVADSISQKLTSIVHFFQANKAKHEYYLTITDSLDEEGKNFIVANNIFDKYGNEMVSDAYDFVVSTAPDTLAPTFKKIETGFEQNKFDHKNPLFILHFSDGIKSNNFREAVSIKKKGNNLNFSISRIDDASYQINILNALKPNNKLELNIDNQVLWDAAGNQLDSVQTIELETLSGREFSGVSGLVEIPTTDKNIIIVLEGVGKVGKSYYTLMRSDRTFKFEQVLPGNYLVWCFIDSDKNGKFNFGKVDPFHFAERFFSYPDTLKLKARWPVGDVIINEESQLEKTD